jgi:hypothetical protein
VCNMESQPGRDVTRLCSWRPLVSCGCPPTQNMAPGAQERLSRMAGTIQSMWLLTWRLSALHEAGEMSHAQASLVKAQVRRPYTDMDRSTPRQLHNKQTASCELRDLLSNPIEYAEF